MIFHSLPQNNPLIRAAQHQTSLRPSLYAPILKVRSQEGYLFENADIGVGLTQTSLLVSLFKTTVRVLPDLRSDALQILVEDPDLVGLLNLEKNLYCF